MDNEVILPIIGKNEEYLRNIIGYGFDINYCHFVIPAFNNCAALIVNINGLNDKKELDTLIVSPLRDYFKLPNVKVFTKHSKRISMILEHSIFISGAKESYLWGELCDAIMEGDTVLFVDESDSALIITTRSSEHRTISEPVTETEIIGPRDGFVENVQFNMILIRKRIKDFGLRFDTMKIGDRTKTPVVLSYIDSLVNDSILNELRTRLKRIRIDSILASGMIEELIEDSPYSIFPQIEHTERPDKATAAILDGRIVILVDNTPFALIVPNIFWNFFQTSGDYYDRYYIPTVIRWVRFTSMFLGLSLSSLYVLLSSYHQEMLPTVLALKIAEGRSGVPFPAVLEAFVMEIIMEIMKEAGLRMPKAIGQTVSIVGSIVIGQALVSAGIVGPFLVVIVSLSAISSYAVPSYSMSNSIRLLRFPLVFLSATLGILGYLGGMIAIFIHLLSLRSFGGPFFAPIIPFDKGGVKDIFIRLPWWKMKTRSRYPHPKDLDRQTTEDLKPKPPSQK